MLYRLFPSPGTQVYTRRFTSSLWLICMGGLPFSDGEGEVVERDWEDGGRERKLIGLEKN